MFWTEETETKLRQLWSEGVSATLIAEQFGGGATRSSVLSKVNRLKLPKRITVTSKSGNSRKKTGKPKESKSKPMSKTKKANNNVVRLETSSTRTPRSLPRTIIPIENVVVPLSRKLSLNDLSETTCRWPNGDPLRENFSFCGNVAAEKSSYCGYHAKIAFRPASERRRSR